MQEISAELSRVTSERSRLQRKAQKERASRHKQREHAFLIATIAFTTLECVIVSGPYRVPLLVSLMAPAG